jgi:hypothetical protein
LNLINIDENGPGVNRGGLNHPATAPVSWVAERRDAVLPVVAAVAGWLLLFFVLLRVPPRKEGGTPAPAPGAEPPAVVSLLAGRPDRDWFGATLADLAACGWFRLSGTADPAGPVMCVVPAETPAAPLAPYERRVLAHVALRAGVRGEVPAPALSDGFERGQDAFMKAFREEVTADTERRGLMRPQLSGRRVGWLILVLLVPAGALALALTAAHKPYPLACAGGSWFVLSLITAGFGASKRPSAAGQAVLDRWHAAADAARRGGARGRGRGTHAPGGDARLGAYVAALGRAPGVAAVFAAPRKNVVWSSYRGGWQQLPVETQTWPWPRAIAFLLAIAFGPMLLFGGVIWLFADGLGWLAERVMSLALGAALVGVLIWLVRRLTPRFAEFDGQVIRQTFVESDEGPDEHRVVVDDGVRATAWDLRVRADSWRLMPPGTFVHARVNLHDRQVSISPVEPPALARPLADPGVAFDPRGGDG